MEQPVKALAGGGADLATRPVAPVLTGGSPPPFPTASTRAHIRFRAALLVAACALAGALSLLLSAVPHFDPFAWTIWGREIVHPDVGLSTQNGPSWKPLPVLFTTPLSLLGDAAPAAWLVLARTAGLVSVVLAYRLGRRLASPAAGVVAAVALVLVPAWLQEVAFGAEMGPLLALSLGALDRHLAGRPAQALGLGFAVALLRVESWPILLLYCAWLWRRKAADRRLIAAVFVLLPVLWFVPDWITLGNPWRGGDMARASTEAETRAVFDHPVPEVLRRAYGLVPLPLQLLAAVAVTLAVRRRRWVVVVLAAMALSWVGVVAAMRVVGYPGLPRFMAPAAAVVCILGAMGAVSLVELAGRRWRLPVATGLAVALGWFSLTPAQGLVGQLRTARAWTRVAGDLDRAVHQAGGPEVVACRHPVVSHPGLTELAWILGIPIASIRTQLGSEGVVFAPRNRAAGSLAPPPAEVPRRPLVRTDEWEVYEVGNPSRAGSGCPVRFR